MKMKRFRPSFSARFLFVVLLLGSVSPAQTADWRAVERLNPGTPISVKNRFRIQCDFIYATKSELACEPRLQGRIPRGPMVFHRNSIHEVRIERVEASTIAGAAIGAGAGAALGASAHNGSSTRSGGAFLIGTIGGIVGGFAGKAFPFLHGEVVYQKP
jgi:hypothetical protein